VCVGVFCGSEWDVGRFLCGDWGRKARTEVRRGCGGCFGEVDEDGCVA
jgi:hypothetical protein